LKSELWVNQPAEKAFLRLPSMNVILTQVKVGITVGYMLNGMKKEADGGCVFWKSYM
jgi:hypothetical protein